MNGYERYLGEPNTIHPGGMLFYKTFEIDTLNSFKNRRVRVYLPSTYDFNNPNHRFKTIYMLDGKNLFDDYTSFVGEWHIDESIEESISKGKSDGYIVIGIDAPETDIDRSLEMSIEGVNRKKKYQMGEGYAYKLAKFIFEVVKPDIDNSFYTLKEKEYTGVGGSSMGGLMAFYLAMEYREYIKYALCFSPAFFLLDWNSFKSYLDKKVNHDSPKIYFYTGGKGFEALFVEPTIQTFNYFINKGYKDNDIKLLYDSEKEHNEVAWSIYFPEMLRRIDQ